MATSKPFRSADRAGSIAAAAGKPSPLRHDVDRLRGVEVARAIGVVQTSGVVGAGGVGERGADERGGDREARELGHGESSVK